MASEPIAAAPKKQRPRKQARLKKRKLTEAESDAESEDEDVKAAKAHKAQQKPKATEKEQEKPAKKRKRGDGIAKSVGGEKGALGEKKPRLPKNKRSKAKAQGEAEDAVTGGLETGGDETEPAEKKEARFIVFIGNLPFTANKAALEKHFAAVKPTSIRLITYKDDPQKCKGFAFLEFEGYDRMQSCLLKFHHTMFNDASGERKINVELTAGGGGGKSQARKTKLHVKNEKLDEQRKRKIGEEEKLKMEKRAKQPQAAQGGMESGIHPSRRRQVK